MVSIRAAKEKELPFVHALLGRAFVDVSPSFFRRRAATDPAFKPPHVRIAVIHGRPVSTCRVVFRRLRIPGGKTVLCGGIADVGTDPEFRDRGLAALCIEDALRYAAQKGAPVSMLFARIQPYYARLGYFSLRMLDLRICLPDRLPEIHCRSARLSRDLDALKKMHSRYGRGRTGPVARNRGYWENQARFPNLSNDFFWTGIDGEKTVCYARGMPGADSLLIQEFGMAPGGEKALFSLLRVMARLANKTGIDIPFVHEREKELFGPFLISARENTRCMVRLLDLRRPDILKCFFKPFEPLVWDSDRF